MSLTVKGGVSGVLADTTATGQVKCFLDTTQQVVTRQIFSDIPRGLVAGAISKSMQGYNLAVGTTFEPLTVASGATYPVINTAITLHLSSDATTDVYGSGTGAWVILVEGLTTGFIEVTETVNLNGRTAVNTVNTYLAINRIVVVATGTNLSNNGAIYIGYGGVTAGGIPNTGTLSAIAANENVSQNCVYTVPAGKTWEITLFSTSANAAGFIQLRTRTNLGLVYYDNTLPINAGPNVLPSSTTKVVPEKTQVQLWCKSAAGTMAIAAVFQGVLRAN